jgi:lipoyl(octanoyl) transferase
MVNPHVTIRLATLDDAEGICAAHIASIREVCSRDYSPEQIEAWAGPKNAEMYRKSLRDGNVIFVADEHGRIDGFIELDFQHREIRAFYLRKEAIGKGIGSELLSQGEQVFSSLGVEEIHLNSTLTSIRFYEARGFTNHGKMVFELPNGVGLECVRMSKRLTSAAVLNSQATTPSPGVPGEGGSAGAPRVVDLGVLPYRDAWKRQEETHELVHSGRGETILLVEHPPVITMGRRGESQGMPNLIASAEILKQRDFEIVQTDRGGDITFHGPGQLVVYPIIRLADHKLTVGSYVHLLEKAVIDALATFEIPAKADPGAIGVWTDAGKICALGVRIRKGVSLHGIALNVTTDLSFFNLIVPCGIADRSVTSLERILGASCPTMQQVKTAVVNALKKRLHLPSPP